MYVLITPTAHTREQEVQRPRPLVRRGVGLPVRPPRLGRVQPEGLFDCLVCGLCMFGGGCEGVSE